MERNLKVRIVKSKKYSRNRFFLLFFTGSNNKKKPMEINIDLDFFTQEIF